MQRFRVWAVVERVLEEDESYYDESDRDMRAEELTEELKQECWGREWGVWVANVTIGCSVGEWAGEEAELFASSESLVETT